MDEAQSAGRSSTITVNQAVSILTVAGLERMTPEQKARAEEVLKTREFPDPQHDALYLHGQVNLAGAHVSMIPVLGEKFCLENAVQIMTNALLRCSGQGTMYEIRDYNKITIESNSFS